MASFLFEQVDLNAIRGFSGQGFSVAGLGPGIMVVHGPNGVGKSTLALAMNLLLWDRVHAPDGTVLKARVRVGGTLQLRDRLQDRLAASAEGEPVAPSPWPGPETRDRYLLSLSDLLQAKEANQAFGEQLRQQMTGVDFPALERAVGALPVFSGSRVNPAVAFRGAQDRLLAQARDQGGQADLEAEIRDLQDRLRDLEGHQQAEKRLTALLQAMDALAALQDLAEPLTPFAAREALLATLSDGDEERFRELVKARNEDLALQQRLEHQIADLDAQLGQLELQPSTDSALEARDLASALAAGEELLASLSLDLAEAGSALAHWERSHPWLASALAEGPFPELMSRETLDKAQSLARGFEESQCAQAALRRVETDLGPEEPVPSALNLGAAVTLLEQWLGLQLRLECQPRAGGGRRGLVWLLLGAGLIASLLAMAWAFRAHAPQALAAAAAALALLGLGALLPPRKAPLAPIDPAALKRDLEEVQERVNALHLAQGSPAAWSAAHVTNAAAALREQLALGRAVEARNGLRQTIRQQRQAETLRWERLRAEAGELGQRLHLPTEVTESFGGYLGLLATQLAEGLGLRAGLARIQGRHQGALTALAQHQDRAEQLLRACARTGGEPKARLRVLAKDIETALRLQGERAVAGRSLEDLQERRTGDNLEVFLASRDLQEATFPEAWTTRTRWKPLLARHDAQHALVANLFLREQHWTPELQALADRHGIPLPERRAQLAELRHELLGQLAQARLPLAQASGFQEDLGSKKSLLERLTREGTLADLLLERDLAAQRLEALRLKELEGRTLDLLLRRLEQRTAVEDVPPQLQRAAAHFQAFTQHRYGLHFGNGTFLAREGAQTLTLDQLSEATRLQLLMAVRLAYVEHQEGPEGIQLPLFLDEVLANCDDQRVQAIQGAILAMAGSGRQIFYFTAQQDEVDKWQTLGGEAVRLIDLGALRQLERRQALPLPSRDHVQAQVPAPGSASLLDYAGLLEAPGASLWIPLHQQHPWLALAEGDQPELHRFLTGGLATLGQLKRYMQDQEGALAHRLATTITLLEAAQAALQAARPRPLAAADLEQARIERLGEGRALLLTALADCQNDPKRLLAMAIPGVGPRLKERLKEWLEAEGHLLELETPAGELLLALKARFNSHLPLEAPAWASIERYMFQAK